MDNAFGDLVGGAFGSAVGNVEHAYLVVFDTGRSRPIKTEEANKLDANKPMIDIPDLIDTSAIMEKLAVIAAYANSLAAMLSALFPQDAVDKANDAASEVAVKKVRVQFNPNHIQVNAIGSKMAVMSDLTVERKKEGQTDSYGYQEVPPRITVSIPICTSS